MRIRVWLGRVASLDAARFVRLLDEAWVRRLTAREENRGVLVLYRDEGQATAVAVVSLWAPDAPEGLDDEAPRALGGADAELAVGEPVEFYVRGDLAFGMGMIG
jgi:hypothetical protein